MIDCRVCGTALKPFMSFGNMPVANGFLLPENYSDEYFYEMATAFCPECGMFQIVEIPAPEQMFHENYAFFTRTSRAMVAHFAEYAAWVRDTYLDADDPFVVEIGSNDGAMLENFAKTGMRHLGVEPSANVAAESERHGVKAMVAFFGAETARRVREEQGPASVILAANVICHIPTINDIAAGIAELLDERGVFVFEEPYLGAMIEKCSYDQIYDEHVFIFSARSVQNAFGRHGLELVNVLPQKTHGGSMRYVLARKGAREVSPAVAELLAVEDGQGLGRAETYEVFRGRCEENRDALVRTIRDLRAGGKRVAGYAATSKSTTVLNYCGLGPDDIEFISDTTPIKQNTFTPGTHIPVKAHEHFKSGYPDYAVLFAWNHEAEIMANEGEFAASGGKWIRFVPKVSVT